MRRPLRSAVTPPPTESFFVHALLVHSRRAGRGARRARLHRRHPRPGRRAGARGARSRPAGLGPDRIGQDCRLRPGDGADAACRGRAPGRGRRAAGAGRRADARTGAAGRARTRLAVQGRRRPRRHLRRRHGDPPRGAGAEPRRHIVVGTPGRLRDHLERGTLATGGLKVVVLDEADEMLDLGFREDLEEILDLDPGRAAYPAVLGDAAQADPDPGQALPARRLPHRHGERPRTAQRHRLSRHPHRPDRHRGRRGQHAALLRGRGGAGLRQHPRGGPPPPRQPRRARASPPSPCRAS